MIITVYHHHHHFLYYHYLQTIDSKNKIFHYYFIRKCTFQIIGQYARAGKLFSLSAMTIKRLTRSPTRRRVTSEPGENPCPFLRTRSSVHSVPFPPLPSLGDSTTAANTSISTFLPTTLMPSTFFYHHNHHHRRFYLCYASNEQRN